MAPAYDRGWEVTWYRGLSREEPISYEQYSDVCSICSMQWKFMRFKRSINFNRVQNVSICRSSSAVINL